MNLNDKLNNIAPIYYLNLDDRPDKREYMESQFDYWKIKDYNRVSTSRFTVRNYHEWKNDVILKREVDYSQINKNIGIPGETNFSLRQACQSLSYLNLVKDWLENTNDKYMIIMEDDYDLSMIEYWHFDWDYLMNNIPYDWDLIQLSFEPEKFFPCFLHPTTNRTGNGALLINRGYAKKIVRLHITSEGKCDISQKTGSYLWERSTSLSLAPDYIISKPGRCYSISLICLNPDLDTSGHEQQDFKYYSRIREIHYLWWKELRDDYTLEEFFTYGKPHRDKVIAV